MEQRAWTEPGWYSEGTQRGVASELYCYTDGFTSVAPGDNVRLSVHTTASRYSLRVVRDGACPVTVLSVDSLPGRLYDWPENSYRIGCGWPIVYEIAVDSSWRPGLYLVIVSIEENDHVIEREGFFVVRRSPESRNKMALLLTTSTLTAYNDWGGANSYRGLLRANLRDDPSPVLSNERPVARGFLRKQPGGPRMAHTHTPEMFEQPQRLYYSWARQHGYSRHSGAAFWATYERDFVVWAERHGYEFDYLTQLDIHQDVEALAQYSGVAIIGHDEYWTWQMRDAVDSFVAAGGRIARFAGNFLWQIRIENDGRQQVCYKRREDPIVATHPRLATVSWDDPLIGRPAARTMGLTAASGGYIRYGAAAPRASGGFTVYRPEHWVFEGTDLYFGDVLGASPTGIAAFEVDGVDFTMRGGLPYPTGQDGAPEDLQILAMTPAVRGETDRWNGEVRMAAPLEEWQASLNDRFPEGDAPVWMASPAGIGAIGYVQFDRGAVFNAGTCDWVRGLTARDPMVEQITHNMLQWASRIA